MFNPLFDPWIFAFQINHAVVSFWANQLQSNTGPAPQQQVPVAAKPSFDWHGLMADLDGCRPVSGASNRWDNRVPVTGEPD